MVRPFNAFDHPASVLALETFRLNGALIAMGDALTAPFGLTSARWQVMGAIAEAQGSLPVASLARNMGLVRQSVQRIVGELSDGGLACLVENPHHKRAKLVQLTAKGADLFDQVNARWLPLAERLLSDLSADETGRCVALLRVMRDRVEGLRSTIAPAV